MKTTGILGLLIVIGITFVTPSLHASPKSPQYLNVQEANLLSSPGFGAQTLATLRANDKLTVLSERGSYLQVTTSAGKTGWVAATSLQKRKLDLTMDASRATSGTGKQELAAAVPGFNSDVEKKFMAKNPTVNMTAVDKMEKWKITTKQSQLFLKQGGLTIKTGSAK